MKRKPTNRTDYREVVSLYEQNGLNDYQLRTAEDVRKIHGFDIRETDGYEDLTDEQKKIFEGYVIRHMNHLGMNTRITLWPKSVHYVKQITFLSKEEYDEEEGRNFRWDIGCEFIILKANGRTKKFKKYLDSDRTEADIDKTTEKEFLRVDWRWGGRNEWFHVAPDLGYY